MKNPFVDRGIFEICCSNLMRMLTRSGPRGYYRPFATRTLVLVSLLLITLTLIALLEYACRTIPNHAGIGALGNVVNGTLKRELASNVQRSPVQPVERLESCNRSPLLRIIYNRTNLCLLQSFLSSPFTRCHCIHLVQVQAQVPVHR